MAKTVSDKAKGFWSAHWQTILIVLLILVFIFQPSTTYQQSMAKSYNSYGGMDMAMDSAEGIPMMARSDIAPMPYGGEMVVQERKITKSGSATVEVEHGTIDGARAQLKERVNGAGGLVMNENEWKNTIREKDYRTVSLSLRIPSEQYAATVDYIKNLGDVKSLSVNLNDVTKQYVDVDEYKKSYELEKAKLQELYDQAEDIEDLIQLQNRLSEVQRMIDRYDQQMENIDERVDYSSIYVTLEEERPLSDATRTFSTFKELVERFLKSVNGIFVFIFWVVPYALAILILYGLVRMFKKKK